MKSGFQGLNRAFALLGALCGLSACVAQPSSFGYGGGPTPIPFAAPLPAAPAGRRIAVLLPLTGSSAELGKSMLRAARLSLDGAQGAAFDERDTKGTPAGAAEAAQSAIKAGAGIFVGPLTAAETDAVVAVAHPLNVPVLAFTSDPSKAMPGVWPFGLTPAQQVRPLVMALRADNKGRLAALLPRNPFGDALADGLVQAAQEGGLTPPQIIRYQPGLAALEAAVGQLGGSPGAPPAFDALLLGTTAETTMAALPALTRAGFGPDRVRLLGTALWARNPGQLAPLAGAWFAAPNQQSLRLFAQNYMARYGTPPRDLSSIAFDAAAAAKAATGPGGVAMSTLVNPAGFSGANGVFVLLPNGQVRRSLAIYEIAADGPHMRDPALAPRPGPGM